MKILNRWSRRRERIAKKARQRRNRLFGPSFEPLEGRLMLARDMLLADPISDSILRFDGDTGAPLTPFVSSGSGGLVNPHNPTFGPHGDLFVFSTQPGAQKILRYHGQTGASLGIFVNTGVGGFQGGTAMAFGPTGDLYVATGGPNVLRYDGATGDFEGAAASGNGIQHAKGIEFGPDGNLYVLDADNANNTAYDRILRFNAVTGAFIDTFVEPGSLEDSAAFTFGSDGHIYVPDITLEQTRSFNGTTGDLQQVFFGEDAPIDSFVFDLVLGPDGNLYAPTAERILRFDGETGEFLNTFVEGIGGSITFFPPAGAAADLSVAINDAPAGAFIGENVSITYTVQNNSGSATPANEWVDVLYWSTDEVFDPFDTEIGRITHTGGLAAGASYTETLSVQAQATVPGDYHVFVAADRRGQVFDAYRLNNLASSNNATELLPRAESVDATHTLAVGRTLSSWTTSGLVANQLTIQYTVYNLTPHYVTNVSLATTLQPGVVFHSASLPADQNGQQLSWSLGRLAPLDSYSVDVVITFPGAIPLQLDTGASATGTVNFGIEVSDAANEATLRTDAIDPSLLTSTIDADSDDIYLRAKAAALDQDVHEIFAFMTEQIRFESYVGSLRGARGTLWSNAGNSLDQASLMIGLLRASGVPARYAQGTLSQALSQDLILSMFPNLLRLRGFLEPDVIRASPQTDPQLLAETRSHYWVELDVGSGVVAADPSFSDAAIGQTFTNAVATFAEVPDSLRHKVLVRLDRELTIPAFGALAGGSSQTSKRVLDHTFNSVELIGRTLVVGHFVGSTSLSSVFTATTHTYTPYLLIYKADDSLDDDELISGTPYQEVFTNFPLGNQVLTGLFLDIEVSSPTISGAPEKTLIEKTLFDRLGFTARQHGGTFSGSIPSGSQPAITELDMTTLYVSSLNGSQPASAGHQLRVATLAANLNRLASLVEAGYIDARTHFNRLIRHSGILSTMAAAQAVAGRSNDLADRLGDILLTRHYFATPRIFAVSSQFDVDQNAGEETFGLEVDILRNATRSYAWPVQADSMGPMFRYLRGLIDSVIEAESFTEGDDPAVLPGAIGVFMQALETPGTSVIMVDSTNLSELLSLPLSEEAMSRISKIVGEGRSVLVPTSMATIEGKAKIAWLEIDPISGESIAVDESGAHSGISQWPAAVTLAVQTASRQLGTWAARQAMNLAFRLSQARHPKVAKKLLRELNHLVVRSPALSAVLPFFQFGWIHQQSFPGGPPTPVWQYVNFLDGAFDPPTGKALVSLPPSEEFEDLGSGATNALTIKVVHDPLFTAVVGSALLPTVYKLGIKNSSSISQRFTINLADITPGYTGHSAVSEIEVGAGQIAEVGLCLMPTANTPNLGEELSFIVRVASATDPTLVAEDAVQFSIPAAQGLSFRSDPPSISILPGTASPLNLRLEATGNVSETVSFQIEVPDALTVSGLSSLILAPGEQRDLQLVVTSSSAAKLNSVFTVNIQADIGAEEPIYLAIPVRIAAPGATEASDAAIAATNLGNNELADRLRDLSISLTDLVENPLEAVYKQRVLSNLENIISQISLDSILVQFVEPLEAASTQLAVATTVPECSAAVTSVGAVLDELTVVISSLAAGDFELLLIPSTHVSQPLSPREFVVKLHNLGTETSTYNVAVSDLPPGVTSDFSHTQVTLDRDEFFDVTLTLTQTSTDTLLAFDFSVDASIDGVTPAITKSVIGSMTVRNEFVSVVDVTPDPPFADPGTQVGVTARLLNAVNRRQDARVSFEVLGPNGGSIFASEPVNVELSVQTSLSIVDLGTFDTTGLALGNYTIVVTLTDALGVVIPGASGQGSLLIGSPVTASMNVNPQTLPPGMSTVTNTLQIDSQTTLLDPLDLVGQAAVAGATDAIRHGNFVYVASPGGIRVFNIAGANLSNPQLVRTVGSSVFSLHIRNNLLIAIRNGSSSTKLDTYSLADPSSPQLLGTTGEIPYGSAAGVVLTDTHAFVAIVNFIFTVPGRDIVAQNGGVLAINIANPATPFLDGDAITAKGTPAGRDGVDDGVLFNVNGTSNDGVNPILGIDQSGGNQMTWALAQVAPTILLLTGSSASGTNTQAGVGLVRVIDISDPRNMDLLVDVQVPGTVHVFGIATEGDIAVITAIEGGITEFNPAFPFAGNVVLAALDLSIPSSPVVLPPQELSLLAADGITFDASLGNGLFAFGGGDGTQPRLYLVDAKNPNNLVFAGIDVPAAIASIRGGDNLIFTTDRNSLIIYEVVDTPGISVIANVQIPKGTGVAIIPGSFNIPPTQIIAGPDYDTLVWELALTADADSQTITWQTTVSALQPGESRPVTLDTTIDFNSQDTDGQLALGRQNVFAEQVLALDPATQTKRPGETAVYTLTIENPSELDVFYDLSILGIPQEWIDLDLSVFVAAGSSVDVPLTLTSGPFATLGDYGFVVTATTDGVSSSVEASLTLAGDPLLAADFGVAKGVFIELIPTSAIAGRGTSGNYKVRVTNTGSATDQFVLFATGLPPGFTILFDSGIFEVPPGASNFREFNCAITPPVGTTPGNVSFDVFVASVTDVSITAFTNGLLTVLNLGVDVNISQASGPPNSILDMVVTNTGQVTETFDLAIAAPSALVATLGASSVTLPPGTSQTVPITIGAIDFAFPGAMPLVGIARSRTNNAVLDSDSADVMIDGRLDMTAAFDKDVVELPAPGPASFLLLVDNLGNLEDRYTAQIVATTGPVTANLRNLDGQPTQSIPLFILPGLSNGAILLDSMLTANGVGTVTLQVRSLSDNSIVAQAVANVTSSQVTTTTVASSHSGGSTYGQTVTFTATVSADSGSPAGLIQFQIDGADFGLPVALENGSADIQTSLVTAGQHTISALFTSSIDVFLDSQGSRTQTVARAPLKITADNKTKVAGDLLPPLTTSYDGFVNGDTPANLDTPATLSTTATATSPAGNYPIVVSGAADANYTITFVNGNLTVTAPTVGADLLLTSTGSPTTAQAGKDYVTYTFTVKNIGKLDATGVKVSLASVLPAGVTVKSVSAPSGTSFSDSGGNGTWNIAKIKKNDSLTLTVKLTIGTATVPGTNVIQTTATATFANQGLVNTSNDSTTQSTSVTTCADIAVTKHTAPSTASAGNDITYEVTITNSGPGAAYNVRLVDMLPVGTTFVSQSQISGPVFALSSTATQVTNSITSLAAGASAKFSIVARVGTAVPNNQKLTNKVTISTDSTDPKTSNNASTASTTIVAPKADLSITKHTAPTTVQAGGIIAYTITICNSGPTAAMNVSLVDMLPAGTAFVQQTQTSGPSFVLGNSLNQVNNTITSLASDASATFTILIKVDGELPRDHELKNKVTVSSSTADPKSTNNSSTVATKVFDSAAGLHASPSEPTKLDLVVTGSTKNDTITVEPASGGKLSVKLNGKNLGTFSPTRNIVVYGRAGNDTVTISSQINRTAILFGGSGDDKLQAGSGSSVLSGGDGKDNLIAGAARNILIAGKAANTLNGKLGENVLIGGSTDYDANQAALEKLLAEWSRTDAAYAVRVQHLRGTLSDRLNDPFALDATTVVDNESVDQLLAGLGSDWFLADRLGNDADQLSPLQAGELVDAI